MHKWPRITIVAAGAIALALISLSSASGSPSASSGGPARAAATQQAPLAQAPLLLAPPTFQPPTSEASFVAVTPCRVVDTRIAGGKIPKNGSRSFYVAGTQQFVTQGGKPGGCKVPDGATAVAATITATQEDNTGFLRAWPVGAAEPEAAVLNFTKNVGMTTGATLPIATGAGKDLSIRSFFAASHVLIDITGYYAKPMAGMISASGAPYSGSSRIVSSARAAAGVYDVQFDRDIRYCSAVATVYTSAYYASTSTYYSSNPASVRVYVWNAAGAAADQYFYITVSC